MPSFIVLGYMWKILPRVGLFSHFLSVISLILIKIVHININLMQNKFLHLSLLTKNFQLNSKWNILNSNTSISQCTKSVCAAIRQVITDWFSIKIFHLRGHTSNMLEMGNVYSRCSKAFQIVCSKKLRRDFTKR